MFFDEFLVFVALSNAKPPARLCRAEYQIGRLCRAEYQIGRLCRAEYQIGRLCRAEY